jgi:hypothetical protein
MVLDKAVVTHVFDRAITLLRVILCRVAFPRSDRRQVIDDDAV